VQTDEVFKKIMPIVKNNALIVREIAEASSEQASNIGNINSAVERINSAVQDLADISSNMRSNVSTVYSSVENLHEKINYFQNA
jgi:methyl-accepting chemotaxis protein